jgi:hypothetical protein
MRNRTVMGIFDRPGDAEKVKEELLEAGVARHRIVISRLGAERLGAEPDIDSDDAIVGEFPDPEKLGEAAQSGACLVAVVARSPLDRQQIARLMLRYGARETVEARA